MCPLEDMEERHETLVVPVRSKPKRRMRSSAEKRRIVEETFADGVSVAQVARQYGVNANLLFSWRKLYQQGLLEQCREPATAWLRQN